VEEAGTRLSLQEARRLDELADDAGPKEFRVRLEMPSITEEALDRLEDLFTGFPGSCQVVFELCSADGSLAVLPAQQRVKATQELMDEVRRICGESAVAAVGE
jgi:hypothetical protein